MPDELLSAENRVVPIGPAAPGQPNSLSVIDFSSLMQLAQHSGGVAYFNTNGLWQAMEDATSKKKTSYTLGFYTSEEPDNRFHSLRVTTTQPGLHLRYKPGYWAFKPGPNGPASRPSRPANSFGKPIYSRIDRTPGKRFVSQIGCGSNAADLHQLGQSQLGQERQYVGSNARRDLRTERRDGESVRPASSTGKDTALDQWALADDANQTVSQTAKPLDPDCR